MKNSLPSPFPFIAYFIVLAVVFFWSRYSPSVNDDTASGVAVRHVQVLHTLRSNLFEEAARKVRAGDFKSDKSETMRFKIAEWFKAQSQEVNQKVREQLDETMNRLAKDETSGQLAEFLNRVAEAYQ